MNDRSTPRADPLDRADASPAATGAASPMAAEPAVSDSDAGVSEAGSPDQPGSAASDPADSSRGHHEPAAAPRSAPASRSIDTDVRQFTRADLTRAEQQLLDELAAGQVVDLLMPTGTRLDTGNWLMRGKVWLACTEDRLLVFAAGRQPHAQATAFAQLGESLYNHVTGQLVLAPAPRTQVQGLKLSAKAAKSLLARFQSRKLVQESRP